MSESSPGKYIVSEGLDGAGKSTQVELLTAHLGQLGRDVISVAEPGSTPIGRAIRAIALSPDMLRCPESSLDLFNISRRELRFQVTAPAVEAGQDVVSDRNWFSAVAMQGFGEGINVKHIIELSKRAMGDFFLPDFAVILDIPLEVAAARVGANKDWFESQGDGYYEKVREGYLWIADQYDVTVIDGAQSIQDVHADIIGHLGKLIKPGEL